MAAKKKPAAKRKPGRPTKYPDGAERMAEHLCLLGATDDDLAAYFDVDQRTINRWKNDHPAFCQALKDGKEGADAKVARRLYERATGYEHDAVKIVADAKTGADHIVPYVERYPPDTTAAIFWLKNRRPDLWRDKRDHEHTGKDGGAIEVIDLTPIIGGSLEDDDE